MEKKGRALFYFEGQTLTIVRAGSVLENLLAQRIEIDHSCGGFATCGTCRVIVDKDVENLPERNALESEFAAERGFREEERLACQLPCREYLSLGRPYFFKMKKGFE